jgi:hypothetical protein
LERRHLRNSKASVCSVPLRRLHHEAFLRRDPLSKWLQGGRSSSPGQPGQTSHQAISIAGALGATAHQWLQERAGAAESRMCGFHRTSQAVVNNGSVRSRSSLHAGYMTLRAAAVAVFPVFGVPRGSISRMWASSSATGRCSTPLGTTNTSPGPSLTAPSLS